MIKRYLWAAAMLCSVLGSLAQAGTCAQTGPSLREIVWRAMELGLEERGLGVTFASPGKERMVSDFHNLDPRSLPEVAALSGEDRATNWAGAEYRYHIDIGPRAGRRGSLFVRAEIRAWENKQQKSQGSSNQRVLKSNRTLEKQLLQSLPAALVKADAELAKASS